MISRAHLKYTKKDFTRFGGISQQWRPAAPTLNQHGTTPMATRIAPDKETATEEHDVKATQSLAIYAEGSGLDTDSGTSSDMKKCRQEESTRKNDIQGISVATKKIGKAGEPLPAFKNHMIRQRVDRHGNVFPLGAPSSLQALQIAPNEIGVI